MAVEYVFHDKSSTSRTSEYRIPPEELRVDPRLNGRHGEPTDIGLDEKGKLRKSADGLIVTADGKPSLIQSILWNGQTTALTTYRGEGGAPFIESGHRRWRSILAINKFKLTAVPMQVRCVHSSAVESDRFWRTIAENRDREMATKVDDAGNVAMLAKLGIAEDVIAQRYGESVAWVRRMLKIAGMTEEARAAVATGKVSKRNVALLADLSAEAQRAAVKKAAGGKVAVAQAEEPEVKLPSRKEMMAEIDKCNSPGLPKDVREFIEAFQKYATGKTKKIYLKD